jgi:hypothetical protein
MSELMIAVEPTEVLQEINGHLCRVWTGTDDHGVLVHAFILAVQPQTHDPMVARRYEAELHALPPAQAAPPIVIDMRSVN